MCVDRKVCTRTVRTGHELQTAFHLRKFFKSSKEKYCVSFSIQARDNSSFHESSGGMGWGSSENKRESGRERENQLLRTGLSLFPFTAVFSTTLFYLSIKEGRFLWPPADLQMLTGYSSFWLRKKRRGNHGTGIQNETSN